MALHRRRLQVAIPEREAEARVAAVCGVVASGKGVVVRIEIKNARVIALVAVVAFGVAVGAAFAAAGDVWQGSAQISTGGAPVFIGQGYVVDTPPVYVYEKTITFSISDASRPAEVYTVNGVGRLFGNQQFNGAFGNEVTQSFGFRGSATLIGPRGTILCRGTLVAGGRWDGDAFGELTLPTSCVRFGGQQYVSFKTRIDGTSTDNTSMLQR
jgi:hypothetical protein